jgi:hypothetical protein
MTPHPSKCPHCGAEIWTQELGFVEYSCSHFFSIGDAGLWRGREQRTHKCLLNENAKLREELAKVKDRLAHCNASFY